MSSNVADRVQDRQRLEALRALCLLDTPAEESFDRLARLATRILNTPVALVSLVDRDRQFFKSCLGLPEPWSRWRETPLSHSFCQHVVTDAQPLVIRDARCDPMFADNPAIRELNIVAYLGSPLTLNDGHTIGSFCVIDAKPRDWTESDVSIVRDLAAMVMSEIELRTMRDRLRGMVSEQAQVMGAAIQHQETQFRAILDALPALVWVSGTDKGCTYFNKPWLEFRGRTLDQERGDGWSEGVHPEDRTRCLRIYQEAFDARREFAMEYRLRNRAGDYRWMLDLGRPYEDTAGQFAGYVGGCVDVTERRRTEERLIQAEATRRATFEAALDCIIEMDHAGRISEFNATAEKTFGFTRATVVGRELADVLVPAPQRAQHRAGLKKFLATGEHRILNRHVEMEALRADGTTIPVELMVRVIENSDPPKFIGFARDISARRKDEARLREQFAELEYVYASVPAGLALLDRDLKFVRINEKLATINGRPVADHLGRTLREVIPDLADILEPIYHSVLDTGEPKLNQEIHGVTPADPDHERDWLASYFPVIDQDGGVSAVGVFVIDVTEQKNLIQELTVRNVEMENFIYTISHDLKTPLITISGFASMLKKMLPRGDTAEARDSLDEIIKAAGSLNSHIQDLLTLSRVGRAIEEKQTVALNRLAVEARDQLLKSRTDPDIQMHIAPDLPTLHLDRKGFLRVFTNLLDNAIKYRRPGVPLVIEVGWERDANEVRLYVRDNGQGIKPEYQSRVFGLFQRADSQTEGAGVGLAISKRVVEVHGGRMWVESESGQGSVFWIALPERLILATPQAKARP